MRPAIGTLISECFYEGRLQNGDIRDAGEMVNVFKRPVTWYSTAALSDRFERSQYLTFANPAESRVIAALLRDIDRAVAPSQRRLRVAVLAAYAGQRIDIRRRLDAGERLAWLDIECNTVDAFQGREAHIAIYSVTRSNAQGNLGFLRELRRLNVALSRARFGLAIVGDHVFARNAVGENPFRRVVEFIEQHPEAGTVEVVR
jgi:superfamily I DNA and/or RNA helicase